VVGLTTSVWERPHYLLGPCAAEHPRVSSRSQFDGRRSDPEPPYV